MGIPIEMMERRRIPRKYMMYYTRVFKMPGGVLLGHLVDITSAGAMIISEGPIPTDQTYRVKLELSPDVSETPYMIFNARSVWCKKDVDPRFHNTGFEILEPSEEQVAIIDRIIEAYGFRDNEN